VRNLSNKVYSVGLKNLAKFGFNRLSFQEMATELGVTKATVYYYYPKKEKLVLEVLNEIEKINREFEEMTKDPILVDSWFDLFQMRYDTEEKKYYTSVISKLLAEFDSLSETLKVRIKEVIQLEKKLIAYFLEVCGDVDKEKISKKTDMVEVLYFGTMLYRNVNETYKLDNEIIKKVI